MALPLAIGAYYAVAPSLIAAGAMMTRMTPQIMRAASTLSQSVRTVGGVLVNQIGNQMGNASRLAGDFSRVASSMSNTVVTKMPSISNAFAGAENTVETVDTVAQNAKANLSSLNPF